MTLLINQSIFIHIVCLWTQWVFSHVFTMSLTDEIGQNKHSNCPGFPGTVPGFGMLSWYPGLNRFVPVFRFLTNIFFIFTWFFISSAKNYTNQINVFSLFDSIIYSSSYFECYKKHNTNSFQLNKNAILKTFNLNVWVLFQETYIRFDIINSEILVQKLSSGQFFFENIKIESNSRFLKYYIRVYQR